MTSAFPVRKTPIADGRATLEAAKFRPGPNAGSRGEVWIHDVAGPAFVSYVGPPYGQYFSTESLETALNSAN
jgi:hypothetical protein